MNARTKVGAEVTKPRKAGVSGLRDLALDVEVEDGLGAARSNLGEASPSAITHPTLPVSVVAVPDEVHVEMIAVGRPVGLEIVEKRRPVWGKPMPLSK
jgi:hypothetical protein